MASQLDMSEADRYILTTVVCPYVLLGTVCTCQCANGGKPLPPSPGLHAVITCQLLDQLLAVRNGNDTPIHWQRLLASSTDQLEQLLFVNGHCPWGSEMPVSDDKSHIVVSEATMRIRGFLTKFGSPLAIERYTEEMRDNLDALAALQIGIGYGLTIVQRLWISVVIGHSSDVNGKGRVRVRYIVWLHPKYSGRYHEVLLKEKLHEDGASHTLIWPQVWKRDGSADGALPPSTGVGLGIWEGPKDSASQYAPHRGGSSGRGVERHHPASYHTVKYRAEGAHLGSVKCYTPAQYAELEARQWNPDMPLSGSLTRPFEAPNANEIEPYLLDRIRECEAIRAIEAAAEGYLINSDGFRRSSALVQDPPRDVPSSPKHRSTSSATLRPLLRHTTSFGDLQTPSLVKKRSVTFGAPSEDCGPTTFDDAETATYSAQAAPIERRRGSPVPDAFFERNRSSFDTDADLARPDSTDEAPTSSSAARSTPSGATHHENVIAHTPSTPEHRPDTPIHALEPPKSSLKGKEPERVDQTASWTERTTQHQTLNPYVPGPDPWGPRSRTPFARHYSPPASDREPRQDESAPPPRARTPTAVEALPAHRYPTLTSNLQAPSHDDNAPLAHRGGEVPVDVDRRETTTIPSAAHGSGSSITTLAPNVTGAVSTISIINEAGGESEPAFEEAPRASVSATTGPSTAIGQPEIIELSDDEEIDVTVASISAPIVNVAGGENGPASGEAPISAVPPTSRPPPATAQPDIIELLSDDDDDEIEVLVSLPPPTTSGATTTSKRKRTSSESDDAASVGGPAQTRRKANPGTGSGVDPWIVFDSE